MDLLPSMLGIGTLLFTEATETGCVVAGAEDALAAASEAAGCELWQPAETASRSRLIVK
jgi:hypothetical protein